MNETSPAKRSAARHRLMFVEGNVDGTVGGSYFSLLYLVGNLDRSAFDPIVVFHQSNDLIPEFESQGIRTEVLPIPSPLRLSAPKSTSGLLYKLAYPLLATAKKVLNVFSVRMPPAKRITAIDFGPC